jgi:HSP20 family protein
MSLIRRNENYPTWSNFFNDVLNHDWDTWFNTNYSAPNSTMPAVNIKEDADKFEIELAAPDMAKEDFKLELNNNVLTIAGEKKTEDEKKEGEKYTHREFYYKSFTRTFTLPSTTDGEKIAAKYDKGVLKVSVPKRDESKPKPSKLIEIA